MGAMGLMTIVWNAALVGFAAMTEHGPPGNVLDSRLRGNDRHKGARDFVPAGDLGVSWAHAMRPYVATP